MACVRARVFSRRRSNAASYRPSLRQHLGDRGLSGWRGGWVPAGPFGHGPETHAAFLELAPIPHLTPGTEGDAMDAAYRAGDQRAWQFECPACQRPQPLAFEQLRGDSSDTTKPEGKWRFDALAETIRFECVTCSQRIEDTPIDRRWIENHGRFVSHNPNAPREGCPSSRHTSLV